MKTAKLPPTRNNGHAKVEKAVAKSLADQVREDGENRRAACIAEVQEVLKKHQCSISITPVVQIEGRPIQVVIVPQIPS